MADLWDEDWAEDRGGSGERGSRKRLILLVLPLFLLGAWLMASRLGLGAQPPAPRAPLPELLLDLERWDAASSAEQDRAVAAVAERLKPSYELVAIERFDCEGVGHRIARFRHKSLGIDLMLLPAGRFEMGTNSGQKDERPAHPVQVRRPFLLARFELSQEAWDKVGGEDKRFRKDPELPIEGMSWYAAKDWLAAAGDGLRLPSEAEWEYACRAGSSTEYFWGEQMDDRYCWYRKNAGFETHSNAEHADVPNAFGLVDMVGNVEEFCEDGYFFDYAGGPHDERARSTADVPRRDPQRFLRCGRGGHWNSRISGLRSAGRNALSRNRGDKNLGLRLALSIP